MLDVACAAMGFIVTFGTDEAPGGWILGRLADEDMVRLGRAVVVFFGLAGS